MKNLLRTVLAVIIGVAVFHFVYWMGAGVLASKNFPDWILMAGAATVAIVGARFVWVHTGPLPSQLATSIVVGALITGGIAFSAGFFGPMLLAPDANQGPLLGIFITGPLGFVVGAVGGAVYWTLRKRRFDG